MKKKIIIIFSVLAVGALAWYFYFKPGNRAQQVSFDTVNPQYGYIAKAVTATGTIQPVDTVSVGAQVSGVVKAVYVDFNSEVKRGQLLAKVDPSIITAQTEQYKANLSNMLSNLQFQQSNFNRQSRLYDLGAISKAEYQLAVNQYASARATVANAAAQLRLAKRNLSYTDIYSPINGVVLNRNVSEGQTIASSFNAPTLFVIARDLTKMQVRAAVDEADIGGVRPGQNVTFTVDAFPDDVFEGTVQKILLRASVASNVVTYSTLINVDNNDLKLKPGMTASISIYVQEENNVLLIPSRALNFKPDTTSLKGYKIQRAFRNIPGGGKGDSARKSHQHDTADKVHENVSVSKSYVWIKRGDSLVERKIITGLNDDSNVQVIKGLTENDGVITGIAKAENKNPGATTQRSPFMPQMRRRNAAPPHN